MNRTSYPNTRGEIRNNGSLENNMNNGSLGNNIEWRILFWITEDGNILIKYPMVRIGSIRMNNVKKRIGLVIEYG